MKIRNAHRADIASAAIEINLTPFAIVGPFIQFDHCPQPLALDGTCSVFVSIKFPLYPSLSRPP